MQSRLIAIGAVQTPDFQPGFSYMTPVEIGGRIPDTLNRWSHAIAVALGLCGLKTGTAWVTLDEKALESGQVHRRPGPHMDGNYRQGAWGVDGWKGYDQRGGLFLLASAEGARAWTGDIPGEPTPWNFEGADGKPSDGGDCAHMDLRGMKQHRLLPNVLYWMNSCGIHESIPVHAPVNRSLMRLTLPHYCPQL